jgi:hypothetical protein
MEGKQFGEDFSLSRAEKLQRVKDLQSKEILTEQEREELDTLLPGLREDPVETTRQPSKIWKKI